jgi:chorismate mutase
MSNTRRDRQLSRQEDAKERQEVRASRSNSEQITRLDSILGKGKGAVKERARLAKEVTVSKTSKKSKKSDTTRETDAKPKAKQKAKERRAAEKQGS